MSYPLTEQLGPILKTYMLISSATTTELVAAPAATKRIRILSVAKSVAGTSAITFQSGTTNTELLGVDFGDNFTAVYPHNPVGWGLDAEAGESLEVVTSAAEDAYIAISYQIIDA